MINKISNEDFQNAVKEYEVKFKEQQIANETLKSLREQTTILEDDIITPYCRKRVVEVFGEIINFFSFSHSCYVSLWGEEKSVCLDKIIELNSNPKEYLAHVGGGRFLWINDCNFRALYPRHIVKDKEPFESSHLLKLCSELSEELGIKVEFNSVKFVESFSGSHPYCIDDVSLIHKNCKVLCSGIIEYVGWDIGDEWVLIEDFDGKHLYYGTTAHGGGLNVHIKPGESCESFLNPPDDVVIENLAQAKSFLI